MNDTKNQLQEQVNSIFSEMEILLQKSQSYDSLESDQAISELLEMPLEIKYRSGWSNNPETLEVSEICLVLSIGGPNIEIIGQIENGHVLDVEFRGSWWSEWFYLIPEHVKPERFDEVCTEFTNFFLEGVAI